MTGPIIALSRFLAAGLLRQKAVRGIVVFALAFLGVALALGPVDLGAPFKLFEDLLLSTQTGLLHVAALLFAHTLVHKEKPGGVFVLPLSTSLGRGGYLASQYLALGAGTFLAFAALLAVDLAALFLVEGSFRPPVLWQLFLSTLSAGLLGFLFLTLARFVSPMNGFLYALALFAVGSGSDEFLLFAAREGDALLRGIAAGVYYLLPNFSFFDHTGPVVNRSGTDPFAFILFPLLYFVAYGTLLFAAARAKLEKKALLFER